MQITFSVKLSDENTLAGALSGPRGEIPWTAARVKEERGTLPNHSQVLRNQNRAFCGQLRDWLRRQPR